MPDPVTSPVTTLVLLRYGSVGPVHPEDGVLVALPLEVADALVGSGDAAPVGRADCGKESGGARTPLGRGGTSSSAARGPGRNSNLRLGMTPGASR